MYRRRRGVVSLGIVAVAAGAIACSTASAAPFENGSFVSVCEFSHESRNDPIVFPRQRRAAHLHHFFGNRSTNARSTPRKLRRRKATTCDADDRSAYWAPALLINGKPVTPTVMRAYYLSAGKNPRAIQAPPKGLRVVAGDGHATAPQPPSVANWSCSSGFAGPLFYTGVPYCNNNMKLVLSVHFPDCWNGRDLDSPDHVSHLAYAVPGPGLFAGPQCPATHPVAIPSLQMRVLYPTSGARSGIELSSGGINSGHMDFMNGWPQRKLEAIVANCIRRAVDCAN